MFRLFLLCLNFLTVFSEPPTVATSHGQVSGKVLKTLYENKEYYAFMGIPYAEPPLGELKFLPPRDLDPWNETLIATKERPACVQFNNNIKKKQPLGEYGKEDCLYLDIFTPNTDENKRAVIVFIYSERLSNSYNKTKDYAHDFFLEEDVVVVTPSHRLGVFGFLSFEDDVLPGNSGLLDLYAALKWISKNIGRFGGDPKRVTLMGSQGGAAAVDLLIRSKAKELFNSAILQSGTSFTSMYLQESVLERALKLGKLLEIPSKKSANLLRELQGCPIANFFTQELRAVPDDYNKDMQRSLLPFGPIVEKSPNGFITKYPENTSDEYNIPLMVGFNSREGIELSLNYLLEPNFVGSLNKDFPVIIPKRVDFRFDPIDDTYIEAAEEIKNFYFKKKKFSPKSVPEFITYIGDVINAYAINAMVENYAKKNSVYYYYFDYYSNFNQNKNDLLKLSKVNDGTWGAALGDELCYLFKCPELNQEYIKNKHEESDVWTMQKKLIKMWTTFAKYGHPTIDDNDANLEWPKYDEESKQYLSFGHEVKIKKNLLSERFKFWDDFINKWKNRAVNGVVTSINKKDELYFL
ncbi:unnamed protein product [Pieris macdunnoughi]|uniref:Carboxylesterase type B domain-containing protein n=1 Tax=Pieris macdunnoughi TaxID=345717 RepID=A0A821PN94_9NEOP|nr:unnamed protein product [Pieris macdunnoughi]